MGKLRYTDLASNEKALLAHTGFKPDEFETLCPFFGQAWRRYLRTHTLEGKPRERHNRGRTNETLPTIEDKLLFVLTYLKTNPWEFKDVSEPYRNVAPIPRAQLETNPNLVQNPGY